MSNPVLKTDGATLPFALTHGNVHAESTAKEYLIDAMRGMAALLVAYFHCRQVVWIGMGGFHQIVGFSLTPGAIAGYLTLPIMWGSAGVPVFFVISGYCIHRSGALRLATDPDWRLDLRNFWARRFARIYPVLFAALLFTLALDYVSLGLPPVNHRILSIGWRAFLVNLFSLQGVAGKPYGSNGALWTLSLEVQFYAVYPLLLMLRRRFGINVVLLFTAVVSAVSGALLQPHYLYFFTSYWFSWTLGAWIADVKAQRTAAGLAASTPPSPMPPSRWLYGAAAGLALLGCAAFHFGEYGAFQLWSLAFTCYLYRALEHATLPSGPLRLMSRFGHFSFSLYLVHLPIYVLLGSILYRSVLQVSIWPSVAFMLVSLPVAWVFYRLIELPAMRWSGRLKARAALR